MHYFWVKIFSSSWSALDLYALGMLSRFFSFDLLWNKYFLASIVFLVWMLFFDENRLAVQLHLSSTIEQLEEDKTYFITQREEVDLELEKLEDNLEKYAREKYFMKKPDEEVFIIERK